MTLLLVFVLLVLSQTRKTVLVLINRRVLRNQILVLVFNNSKVNHTVVLFRMLLLYQILLRVQSRVFSVNRHIL